MILVIFLTFISDKEVSKQDSKRSDKKPDAFSMTSMVSSIGRGARRMCCGSTKKPSSKC